MRYVLLTPLFLGWLACTGSPTPPERPARKPLTAQLSRVANFEIEEKTDGPWAMRIGARIPDPHAAEPTSEDDSEFSTHHWSTSVGLGGGAGTRMRAADESTPADPSGPTADPAGPPRTGPLRAGSTDDNRDHDAFVTYLAEKAEPFAGEFQPLDVADRRTIAVVERDGTPIPAARVDVVDPYRDTVLWRGTTYGDGTLPFYPSLLPADAPRSWMLEIRAGENFARHLWNGEGERCTAILPRYDDATPEVQLDVVLLLDTTGSMSDELSRIKKSLRGVTEKLGELDREFDLRYGAVLYRDLGDAYVTKTHAFTADLTAFDKAMQEVEAHGGGDVAEALNQGLAVAVDGMAWRGGAAKLIFLIADAPPHMDYDKDVPYADSLVASVARGIRIHAVAASGLPEAGTVVFRQLAHFTRGKFIFVEYGGDVVKSAKAHDVTAPVKSNNLDDILYEQIRAEITGWAKP